MSFAVCPERHMGAVAVIDTDAPYGRRCVALARDGVIADRIAELFNRCGLVDVPDDAREVDA